MITTTREIYWITLLGFGLLIGSAVTGHPEIKPLEENRMRSVTAQEGLDLRFNFELGTDNALDENVHLNIRDANGFGSSGSSRNLAILGLWLTLNVGASDDDVIAIDTVNTSPSTLQLSMSDGSTFSGLEAEIENGIFIRNSQTGTGGTEAIPRVEITDGSFGAGSLDFDGNLQIWGAEPPQ